MGLSHKDENSVKDFGTFIAELAKRLDKGHQDYGDASFRRPMDELCDEIGQELMDVCGWSFIQWRRLRELKKEINRLLEEAQSISAGDAESSSTSQSPITS